MTTPGGVQITGTKGDRYDEVLTEIARLPGKPADYAQARATFVDVAIADDFAEFLTLPAYERMP